MKWLNKLEAYICENPVLSMLLIFMGLWESPVIAIMLILMLLIFWLKM